MTNYNERLDEALSVLYNSAWVEGSNYKENNPEGSDIPSKRELAKTAAAKQALTSLIKELVAEVKPEKQFDLGQVAYVEDTGGKRAIGRWVRDQQQFQIKNGTGSDYMDGYNSALDRFEQNLLKALEEV